MRSEIKANSASGIIVTHSHTAAATADRVLVLRKDGLHVETDTEQVQWPETARQAGW